MGVLELPRSLIGPWSFGFQLGDYRQVLEHLGASVSPSLTWATHCFFFFFS